MKNVLVTGGAGFIGSALIRGLLEEPGVERIVALDNLLTGHERNLAEVNNRIEFHNADIRDLAALEHLFTDIDVVFHQAAIPSVPRSIDDPQLTHEVNINGTFNVLLAAQRRKVSRVVYAASSSAYGDTVVLPKIETLVPRPKSPYAVQKLVGEYYARTFLDNYGLATVCLRYFNVFGPRQDPASPYSGVIALFCTAALAQRAPTIFGDGEQTRDFTYVDNIVQLNLLAARSPTAPGNVYNGGVGARITLNELWSKLQELEGLDLPPRYQPGRAGDVRDSQADLGAARRDLNYDPRIDLTEGLRRTLAWYRASA
ncbi:MAG: SDR family oxidoreductase [Acidobacteria bacterium]|nr:SDR family oxidoreductase [Acidobacteriota bacterium]